MECPHLYDSVKIDRVRTELKQRRLWKCLECSSDKENWVCLNCGTVLCGRYVNSHALKHSFNLHHKLCMNTHNHSVFCYKCDDFIINETAQMTELRRELQQRTDEAGHSNSQHSNNKNNSNLGTSSAAVTPTSTATKRRNCSGTSIDTGASPAAAIISSMGSGRQLRPRKRTISSDKIEVSSSTTKTYASAVNNSGNSSSSSSNSSATGTSKEVMSSHSTSSTTGPPATKRSKQTLKKVVGLRNLGNTCFMNSVLQSLSNIQEFSCYFNALPSMEHCKQSGKRQNKNQHSNASTNSTPASTTSSDGPINGMLTNANGYNSAGASHLHHQVSIHHHLTKKEMTDDANVVEELRKVLLNLSQGGDGSKAISPECLFLVIWKVVPQFRGHRQHDAHEFLRYMLDRLHTELQHFSVPPLPMDSKSKVLGPIIGAAASGNAAAAAAVTAATAELGNTHHFRGRNSIVTNVFGGVLQSEVRCLICGMESKKHDPFLDLSLDIPERFYSNSGGSGGGGDDGNGGSEPPTCNIADCLSSFTEVEELAETELYYCSSCKCKQKSTKRFWIRRLPNVLCLHIKRFRWSNFFRTKIDLRISFPINALDMSQFVLNNGPETRRSNSSNNVYDLAAVIVHHGNGSSCGHYTSFAINTGRWLHFNDHSVKEVDTAAVAECKPYILFYIRRDLNNKSSTMPSTSTAATTTVTSTSSTTASAATT